eukprot:m.118397 g.118397  ORF g.118397 m.118397 type:complete len:486 (-) comp16117_c0_seq1:873-2330(-)
MATYDYDLVVIGGGSGGLSCSKTAAELGAKVAVLDFVKPSPHGSTWGLGGTCVNVGCIPKKLMHQAGLLGHALHDAGQYGWAVPENVTHSWESLVRSVQDYIGGLNWNYRVQLRDKQVTYFNEYATLVDAHTIQKTNKKGVASTITAKHIVLATGGRPRYPDIPGKEHGISSDDIFMLKTSPGKTMIVGASYIALECAGFLRSLGYDVTVCVRSIFLRGFDQQMADNVTAHMNAHGVKFLRETLPTKIEKLPSGRLNVSYSRGQESLSEEFDTVLFAIGRDACIKDLNLDGVGVKFDPKSMKVLTDDHDCTSVPNIFALGDILLNKPELTPVAIQAGMLLARRLFAGETELCDYENVCTTVFTPKEYSCCGLAEEAAIARFGQEDIEVFHTTFTPLEHTVAHRVDQDDGYCKLVCRKSDNMRVLGIHYAGPNAGEVMQGFGIALRLKATKKDFDQLIGIHPTCAENFTTLKVTKSSGTELTKAGC